MQAPSSDAVRAAAMLADGARAAATALARASSAAKDEALRRAAAALRADQTILAANREEVQRARGGGDGAAVLDRLTLTPARIDAMATGLEQIAALPDPV